MPEHQLVVSTRPGRHVPTRIAGLLLPLDIEMVALHFTHPPHAEDWLVELTVRVPSAAHLDFLVKRLDRLVDVLHVQSTDYGHEREEPGAPADSAPSAVGTYAYAN